MSHWRLEVLGGAQLVRGAQCVRLERKAAALLAYLALEGATPKGTLSALLWPEAAPVAAGNNLRQLLRRLRVLSGTELVLGRGVAELAADVSVDVREVEAHAAAGRHGALLALPGVLLAQVDYSDSAELEAWLLQRRGRLERMRGRAREAELARLEAQGGQAEALALVEAWLKEEPTSEEAGRALMRLHFVAGNRTAALTAFEQLREVLARELDVTPMPETLQLARDIERGVPPRAGTPPRQALPHRILRPPVLAGREEAWRQLEEAWAAGYLLYITGEPGVGKTRLATEFAESKGRWFRVEGRVGDMGVPYSSHVRALRAFLAARPQVVLPERVRREVARLLPELARAGEVLPPLTDDADRLRFFDAQAEALQRLTEGYDALVTDDVQYFDPSTTDLFLYMFGRSSLLGGDLRLPRFIDCCRLGELPSFGTMALGQLEETGRVHILQLEPLSPEAVRTLVGGLALPSLEGHAERLARYTGGNPLFVVETVKHLVETGGLAQEWPERMPPPGRVGPLIQRRLARLSALAQRVAQVAALSPVDVSLELVAEVLEVGRLEAGGALAELEAAQLMAEARFTHDLIHEAVLAEAPSAVQRVLHGRLAEALQRRDALPILVAHHYQSAGEQEAALPFLLAAASAEEDVLLPRDAAELYGRAARVLEDAGRQEEATRVRQQEARCRQRATSPSPRGRGPG